MDGVALAFVGALVASTVLLFFTPRLLTRANWLDHPNERSCHDSPTPRGAGVAQAPAMVLGLIAARMITAPAFVSVVAFTLLGALDDHKRRDPKIRLLAQAIIAVVVGYLILQEFPEATNAALTILAIVIVLVTLINATNFMDGVNGMSGVHGVILGLTYMLLLLANGATTWAALAAALAAVSFIFLFWNFRTTAKLFLGDSGSYLFGSTIGVLLITAWLSGTHFFVALLPVTIYLADTGFTLACRLHRRESLFVAHRDHMYQKLSASRMRPQLATLTVGSFSLVCCISTLVVERLASSSLIAIAIMIIATIAYLLTSQFLATRFS